MKTNAIIRIILWSIVIMLLVGVLSSVLFGWKLNRDYDNMKEITHVPVSDANSIHSTQSSKSPAAPEESTVPITTGTESAVDIAHIHKLSIEWVAGDIIIQTKEGSNQIRFAEDAGDCAYPMVYKKQGDELKIQFCKESFGMKNFGKDIRKDLIIEVPSDWVCQELELDVAAADLTVQEFMAKEVDFDGASGDCHFQNCTIGSLDMDAASGDVTFSGSLNTLDLDAAAASFTGIFTDSPRRIDMDGMSGDMDITLPASCGYTAKIVGMSGSIHMESHTTTVQNGMHIYGDGSCRINLDGMSCDLTIRLDEQT